MQRVMTKLVIKWIFFIFLTCLLSLPIVQQLFLIFEIDRLNGSYDDPAKPEFTITAWFNEEYQTQVQNYLRYSIGFRPFFIRLHNQLDYSLFHHPNAAGLVIGKKGFLFEKTYIDAFFGWDFIGEDSIQAKVQKLEKLSGYLSEKGIITVVLLAPGKAAFYPEYIPDVFSNKARGTINYEVFRDELFKRKINTLDFYAYFLENKEKSPYPLYPKTGIHWSEYAEFIVADSTIKFINSLSKERHIPELILNDVYLSLDMVDSDDDIEKGMNLLFNIPDMEMAYPKFTVPVDTTGGMPRILAIGDSYYWGLFNLGYFKPNVFNMGEFWYYNRLRYTKNNRSSRDMKGVDPLEEVLKSDVVLIQSTDIKLPEFSFGFIDSLFNACFQSD